MSYDLHQMMLAEPVKRLQIVTAELADDLGSILRWRKPILLRLGPVLDIFDLIGAIRLCCINTVL